MSTNAIVAEMGEDMTWQGRYCYWDGYPSWMAKALWRIVKRDGIDKARQVLIHDYKYWSQVDHDRKGDADALIGKNIVGYGEAQKEGDFGDADSLFTNESKDFFGATWIYILDENALYVGEVFIMAGPVLDAEGIFPWDEPEPNWEDVEERMRA